MKKTVAVILLGAVFMMCLCGCSGIRNIASESRNIESTEEIQDIDKISETDFYIESETGVSDEMENESTGEESSTHVLDFEPYGWYHFEGFGEMYDQYTFDAPNDKWVVWGIGRRECEAYMIGCLETGRSYADVIVSGDHNFIAVSSKYLLFDTEKGEIAIELTDMSQKVPSDQLTEAEWKDFIYPTKYERVLNWEDHFVKENVKKI